MCTYLPRFDDEDTELGTKTGEGIVGSDDDEFKDKALMDYLMNGGGCIPEAQGVCSSSVYGSHISGEEFEQAHKERVEACIPLHELRKPENSADKISALCDELRDYVLTKHNITNLKEIDEVCDMCHELKKFLLVKNERYGDSALKPIKVFSKGDASDKIDARMDDKLSRIVESDEQRMNDFVDLTGYLVLKCIDKGWTDFSELLD